MSVTCYLQVLKDKKTGVTILGKKIKLEIQYNMHSSEHNYKGLSRCIGKCLRTSEHNKGNAVARDHPKERRGRSFPKLSYFSLFSSSRGSGLTY